jgi:hypothetical protein
MGEPCDLGFADAATVELPDLAGLFSNSHGPAEMLSLRPRFRNASANPFLNALPSLRRVRLPVLKHLDNLVLGFHPTAVERLLRMNFRGQQILRIKADDTTRIVGEELCSLLASERSTCRISFRDSSVHPRTGFVSCQPMGYPFQAPRQLLRPSSSSSQEAFPNSFLHWLTVLVENLEVDQVRARRNAVYVFQKFPQFGPLFVSKCPCSVNRARPTFDAALHKRERERVIRKVT